MAGARTSALDNSNENTRFEKVDDTFAFHFTRTSRTSHPTSPRLVHHVSLHRSGVDLRKGNTGGVSVGAGSNTPRTTHLLLRQITALGSWDLTQQCGLALWPLATLLAIHGKAAPCFHWQWLSGLARLEHFNDRLACQALLSAQHRGFTSHSKPHSATLAVGRT